MRARTALLAATVLCLAGPARVSAAPRPEPAKLTVSPAKVTAGAVTTFGFKYQATGAFSNVDVTLVVPAGWTAPVTSPASANGLVSVSTGTCAIPSPATSVSGSGPWTITLHGVTCGANKAFTLNYAKAAKAVSGPSTFSATVNGIALTPAVVTVNTGAAAKLVFTQPPSGAFGGSAFTTQPKVAITDSAGNIVTTNTSSVTLTLAGGTAGATFSCTVNPRSAVAGVATFAGCKVNKVGTGYTLHAVDGALTPANSTPFAVTAGLAATMAFTQQPSASTASGSAFATQPRVTLSDLGGNVATDDASTVTLALLAPASGGPGVLSGCTQSESSGVVTFAGCAVSGAGTGYKLRATDGSLAAVDSAAFTILGATATKVVFTRQPGGAITGGTPFPTQPQVTIEDASGNPMTGDVSTVTLTLAGGTGTLSGCTQSESNGVVTFAGCTVDRAGAGYTLHAADGALTPNDSAAFTVGTGPAAHLTIDADPDTFSADTGSTTATATVTDAGGNPVAGQTVTFSTGDAGASAGATTDHGDGTYTATISSTTAGGHDVSAADGSLTDETSVTVTPGAVAHVATTVTPDLISADDGTSSAHVTVTDAHGNGVPGATVVVTTDDDVTVGTVGDDGGGAYSAGLASTVPGQYSVTATVGTVFGSDDLQVVPGDPAHVDVVLDDDTISADVGTTNATITVTDAEGNRIGEALASVWTNDATSSTGYVLPGPDITFVVAVNSTTVGTHDLEVEVGTAPHGHATLTVTPGAAHDISLALDPATVGDGGESTATATLTDAHGNAVPGAAVDIQFESPGDPSSIGEVTDNNDGTYSATITASTTGPHGVVASLGTLTDTQTLTVTAAAPDSVELALDPDTISADTGTTTATATVRDTLGQLVSGATVAITSPDTGASVGTVTDNGDGTYTATVTSTEAGTHDITAAVGPGIEDTASLTVTPGAADTVVLALDPDSVSADTGASDATATVYDAYDNPVPGQSVAITPSDLDTSVDTVTDNGDGTYTATVHTTVAGLHEIAASVGTASDTKLLTVTPGAAAGLAFTTQPTVVPDFCETGDFYVCLYQIFYGPPPTANGDAFATQPVVSIVDAGGNVVDDDSSTVTLSIADGTGTSGAALSCDDDTVTATDGVAAFDGCVIDTAGDGYRLLASSGSLSSAQSDLLDIVQAPPSSISLALDTDTIDADGVDYATATVTLTDSYGHPVPGWTPDVYTNGYATVSVVTDNGDGTYTATIYGTTAWTETITAGIWPIFLGFPITDTASLTLLPGPPASVYAVDRTTASATVTEAFSPADSYLCVTVLDYYNNPVGAGVDVDLEVRDSSNGAGATFAQDPVTTDAYGIACASATANETAGSYTIRMSSGILGAYADFNAGNVAGPVTGLEVLFGDDQSADVGTQFADALQVRATDVYGNYVGDALVTYDAPGSGASATLDPTSATTDQYGEAGVLATANGVGGDYDVTASVGTVTATFSLHNAT